MHRRSIRARSLSAPLTQSRCRLCPYPVSASVSESSPGRTGRFPTCYSPVRHSSPEGPSFDLHVLGMPPAFILSQDQTLHLIRLFFFQCLFADIFFFFLFVFLFRCFSRNRRVCFFSLVLVRLIFCFFRFYQVFKDRPAVCFQTACLYYFSFSRSSTLVLTFLTSLSFSRGVSLTLTYHTALLDNCQLLFISFLNKFR